MSCRCSSSFKKTLAWWHRLMACRCSSSFKKTLATVLLFILLLFLLDSPGPDGNPRSRKGRTLRQVFEERRSRMEKYCNSHNETRFWIDNNFQPTLIYSVAQTLTGSGSGLSLISNTQYHWPAGLQPPHWGSCFHRRSPTSTSWRTWEGRYCSVHQKKWGHILWRRNSLQASCISGWLHDLLLGFPLPPRWGGRGQLDPWSKQVDKVPISKVRARFGFLDKWFFQWGDISTSIHATCHGDQASFWEVIGGLILTGL